MSKFKRRQWYNVLKTWIKNNYKLIRNNIFIKNSLNYYLTYKTNINFLISY